MHGGSSSSGVGPCQEELLVAALDFGFILGFSWSFGCMSFGLLAARKVASSFLREVFYYNFSEAQFS